MDDSWIDDMERKEVRLVSEQTLVRQNLLEPASSSMPCGLAFASLRPAC